MIPETFHYLLPLFKGREAERLAPHRPNIDHKIVLKETADGTPVALPRGPL